MSVIVTQPSFSNLLSVFVLVQRILIYYPNYPTHRLYFGEVETPYILLKKLKIEEKIKLKIFLYMFQNFLAKKNENAHV